MAIRKEQYEKIIETLRSNDCRLVAVSKTKPVEEIKALYELGQRDFGENYVQEMVEKQAQLPKDIRWHFIGHLQRNKVKDIAPFVYLIHGVDSLKLLVEINKQGIRFNRVLPCLLQVSIAEEETKFGLSETELEQVMDELKSGKLKNIYVEGLMGMASFTDDENKIRKEFQHLKSLFNQYESVSTPNCQMSILSMGMSADYQIALEQGSTLVRIGSLIFGER